MPCPMKCTLPSQKTILIQKISSLLAYQGGQTLFKIPLVVTKSSMVSTILAYMPPKYRTKYRRGSSHLKLLQSSPNAQPLLATRESLPSIVDNDPEIQFVEQIIHPFVGTVPNHANSSTTTANRISKSRKSSSKGEQSCRSFKRNGMRGFTKKSVLGTGKACSISERNPKEPKSNQEIKENKCTDETIRSPDVLTHIKRRRRVLLRRRKYFKIFKSVKKTKGGKHMLPRKTVLSKTPQKRFRMKSYYAHNASKFANKTRKNQNKSKRKINNCKQPPENTNASNEGHTSKGGEINAHLRVSNDAANSARQEILGRNHEIQSSDMPNICESELSCGGLRSSDATENYQPAKVQPRILQDDHVSSTTKIMAQFPFFPLMSSDESEVEDFPENTTITADEDVTRNVHDADNNINIALKAFDSTSVSSGVTINGDQSSDSRDQSITSLRDCTTSCVPTRAYTIERKELHHPLKDTLESSPWNENRNKNLDVTPPLRTASLQTSIKTLPCISQNRKRFAQQFPQATPNRFLHPHQQEPKVRCPNKFSEVEDLHTYNGHTLSVDPSTNQSFLPNLLYQNPGIPSPAHMSSSRPLCNVDFNILTPLPFTGKGPYAHLQTPSGIPQMAVVNLSAISQNSVKKIALSTSYSSVSQRKAATSHTISSGLNDYERQQDQEFNKRSSQTAKIFSIGSEQTVSSFTSSKHSNETLKRRVRMYDETGIRVVKRFALLPPSNAHAQSHIHRNPITSPNQECKKQAEKDILKQGSKRPRSLKKKSNGLSEINSTPRVASKVNLSLDLMPTNRRIKPNHKLNDIKLTPQVQCVRLKTKGASRQSQEDTTNGTVTTGMSNYLHNANASCVLEDEQTRKSEASKLPVHVGASNNEGHTSPCNKSTNNTNTSSHDFKPPTPNESEDLDILTIHPELDDFWLEIYEV